jgi:hypothetical protein
MKVRSGWKPDMEQRATDFDARQVKCKTADAGHVWIHYYDRLPSRVRQRLAESPFNICAACLDIEAHAVAAERGFRRPTLRIYLSVIEAIERDLRSPNEP